MYQGSGMYSPQESELVSIPIIDIAIAQDTDPQFNGLTERKTSANFGQQNKWKYSSDENDKSRKQETVLNQIFKDRDAKKLFLFISLVSFIALVEILYGFYSESLGLISAGFHSTFHCIALGISLTAMLLSKKSSTPKYSYGYDRFEILSGFTNAIFLIFVCLWLLFESVERLFEPPEPEGIHLSAESTVLVAFVALIVNVVGVIFFHEFKQTRSESRYENLYSISASIIIDGSTHLGVILSTWLSSWGWVHADAVVAIAISVLLGYTVLPICSRTGKVLLQTTPVSVKDQLDKARREVQTLEGVLETTNEHFWTQSPGVFVGSLSVRIRSDANEQAILQRTRTLLAPFFSHMTIQIEKDDWMLPQKAL